MTTLVDHFIEKPSADDIPVLGTIFDYEGGSLSNNPFDEIDNPGIPAAIGVCAQDDPHSFEFGMLVLEDGATS